MHATLEEEVAGTLLLSGPELLGKADVPPPLDGPRLELDVRLEETPSPELERNDVEEDTRSPEEDTWGLLLLVVPLLLLGQLLNCNTDSCAAEIAGAWAVSHLITGSVGKLGNSIILNVKIIDVRVGSAVARLSEKVDGGEEALFDAMDPAVGRLLRDAGFRPLAVATAHPGPAPDTASQPSSGTAARAAGSIPVVRYALWGGGAAAALGAVLGVPLALLGGTSMALCLAGFFSGDPIAGAVRDATTYDIRRAGAVGGAATLAVAVLVVVVLGAAAAGLVTAGVFTG